MAKFTPNETEACSRLIAMALEEDLGAVGDRTSLSIIPADAQGQAAFVARADGVLAGSPAAIMVLQAIEPLLHLEASVQDGDTLKNGDRIATVSGPMRGILTAERTALNFLQHLSGVASMTRRFVDAVAGLPALILDTRKTLPGWRLLDKYAVRCGGGHNHRLGLHDGILIKDNHLAGLQISDVSLQIEEAVRRARSYLHKNGLSLPVEIEVDTLEQFDVALAYKPDMILLDNMPPALLRKAAERRNASAASVLLEASGGVTLETVRAIAETGVDRVSIGALTHSAPALDIALDYV